MSTKKKSSFTVKVFTFFYERFGVAGLFGLPFFTLTCEKVVYDTFQASRGHDIYNNGMHEGARGGFPSGGSNLPSFSLIPVQKKKEIVIIPNGLE